MNRNRFPSNRLLNWFSVNRRDLPWRKTRDPYKIWLSEVMLQQTQVKTVIDYYHRFMERFPDLASLAGSSLENVLKMWEGLGYYARARNFHRAVQIVLSEYNGKVPSDPLVFKKLPGVGDYINAAVLSLAFGVALPVVDGNVLRVLTRWFGMEDDISADATKKKVYRLLSEIIPTDKPGKFNEAMMELGALVCSPAEPDCGNCPLTVQCYAFNNGKTAVLPLKKKKPAIPEYAVSVGIIMDNGKFFIQRRPEIGHLGGLWEFPGGKSLPGETAQETLIRELREELHVKVEILEKLAHVVHIYSHFKIRLTAFLCTIIQGEINSNFPWQWIKVAEIEKFPFPAANHKFFPKLKEYMNRKFPGEIFN